MQDRFKMRTPLYLCGEFQLQKLNALGERP
jgi:hypothetical protein